MIKNIMNPLPISPDDVPVKVAFCFLPVSIFETEHDTVIEVCPKSNSVSTRISWTEFNFVMRMTQMTITVLNNSKIARNMKT